ncbi:hypothetical protein G8V07_14325 [Clostridium botulinum D/C]|uniref:hypothetical protein n=1 Tax=Clostridium botulinum TaxID=1491 RepID=UPI001E350D8F|nr:hypothetical protein [Clostridium botulinum]MCD3321634.1 hypothetical protein [Clostridium botulinum D/C]MCD3324901.1 hypothetical protein [Clostridium botulinum D/C]MCD3328160.1 hypothetical protein [Clostridium botulinum D/C]
MVKSLHEYQSKLWDMDISLEDLLNNNVVCMVDRNYKRHKVDDCISGYCIYLKHPNSNVYSTMIGIREDGFVYIGDGENENLSFENTNDIIEEMFSYCEWIGCKNRNLDKINV